LSSSPEGRAVAARTATELRVMRQRTYAVALDMQKMIENALTDLVKSMDILASLLDGGIFPSDYTISFDFDDSVVSDRDSQFQERISLLDRGIITPEEFRAWYFGESIEEAIDKINTKEPVITIQEE